MTIGSGILFLSTRCQSNDDSKSYQNFLHITKLIKTTGKVTDNSPLFRIFALTITILYELRLNNESKNTDYAWRE